RDGGRHDAVRAGVRRRRRIPLADGARRDRRIAVLDRAVTGVRAGDVHGDGRYRGPDLALWQEARGLAGRQRRAERSSRRTAGQEPARATPGPARNGVAGGRVRFRSLLTRLLQSKTPADTTRGSRGLQVDGVRPTMPGVTPRTRSGIKAPRLQVLQARLLGSRAAVEYKTTTQRNASSRQRRKMLCYSFRATAVSLFMFCSRMRPRCRSRMPS